MYIFNCTKNPPYFKFNTYGFWTLTYIIIAGKIRLVSRHHSQWIFTRATKEEEAEEAAAAATK
jgi:hypothetical protein